MVRGGALDKDEDGNGHARSLAQLAVKLPMVKTDFVGLLDEWAYRFFDELDYITEATNGNIFGDRLQKELPQVVVPRAHMKHTTRRVLTIEWIDGEKLSESQASDVEDLVGIGVIAYLKQLLELGRFHADPHPFVLAVYFRSYRMVSRLISPCCGQSQGEPHPHDRREAGDS